MPRPVYCWENNPGTLWMGGGVGPRDRLDILEYTETSSFFNNQPDTLIIQIYCHKTPHVSGIFSAHHQEFSTVHSALLSSMQVWWPFPSRVRMKLEFLPDSTWKGSSNLHETYQCRMYSRKLLMMGREDARNMWSFMTE